MRYRPFGASGTSISAVTLSLGLDAISRGPDAAAALIYSGLEAGINSYSLESADPVLAECVGRALSSVDRKLLNVGLTLGRGDSRRGGERDFSAQGMTQAIDKALHVSGLGWIDVALLEQPEQNELPQSSLNALKALRATERVRFLGVSGEGEVMDAYVSTGAFDVLATPYHVDSDWRVRTRIRAAKEQDMAVMAYGYFPDSISTPKKVAAISQPKKSFFGFGSGGGRKKNDPLAGAGTFAFLHETNNWNAESICLAHVMTDPAICSVMIEARDEDRLNLLAAVPDRDMPPGLSAQIEMARVGAATHAA